MSDHNILKAIRRMNRKKKWNEIIGYFGLPFRFKYVKEIQTITKFLCEYMLRMRGDDSFEDVVYDRYRGWPHPHLIDAGAVVRNMEALRNKKVPKTVSWYKKFFKKMFREKSCIPLK